MFIFGLLRSFADSLSGLQEHSRNEARPGTMTSAKDCQKSGTESESQGTAATSIHSMYSADRDILRLGIDLATACLIESE